MRSRPFSRWGPAVAGALLLLSAPFAEAQFRVVNVIPNAQSGESDQNSEVSIGVNPLNPSQMVIGAFQNDLNNPLYTSSNGGATWTQFQQIFHVDKSLTWSNSGNAYVVPLIPLGGGGTAILPSLGNPNPSAATPFQANFNGLLIGSLDQPWVRANLGSNGQDHIYVAYNDLGNFGGAPNTASMLFSRDGGNTFFTTTLDHTGTSLQDAPSVRVAVKGDKVYGAFERWTGYNGNSTFPTQVVVVKDVNAGFNGFTDLGAGGNGTVVATTTTGFSPGAHGGGAPPTLGSERIGSDLAITVDPNNADHLYVAYVSVDPNTGLGLQVHVNESRDGGQTFNEVFATSIAGGFQTAQPALAVDAFGDVGLLYNAAQNGAIGTFFTFTRNDFGTVQTSLLAAFIDGNPASVFDPYLGDFTDLTALGGSFYGAFASTNQDDGVNAIFPQGVTFQRSFTGTPGTPSFALNDGNGNPVAPSIDPYFFQYNVVPEPSSWLLVSAGTGVLYVYRRRRQKVST